MRTCSATGLAITMVGTLALTGCLFPSMTGFEQVEAKGGEERPAKRPVASTEDPDDDDETFGVTLSAELPSQLPGAPLPGAPATATRKVEDVLDVSGPTGCARGFCAAVLAGHCGVPDPDAAKKICVLKGYADQTSFVTAPGQPNTMQCSADAGFCWLNQAECNLVFRSVTCRR